MTSRGQKKGVRMRIYNMQLTNANGPLWPAPCFGYSCCENAADCARLLWLPRRLSKCLQSPERLEPTGKTHYLPARCVFVPKFPRKRRGLARVLLKNPSKKPPPECGPMEDCLRDDMQIRQMSERRQCV